MQELRRSRWWVLAIVMIAIVGCSTDSNPPSTAVPTESSTTIAPATTRRSGTIPPFVPVTIDLSEDGTYLVGPGGAAIYLFTLDDERTSTCEAACATAWPPVLGDPAAGEGVDQALLGNAERGDGSIQVTYDGHPLYTYTADSGPGDTNGHQFNDVWFLVDPDGTCIDC